MENTSNRDGQHQSPWSFVEEADRLARPAILVVEDDADIRDMLATLLELAGFVPVACDTAEQGLNALRENSFDLILTDYALPRSSGVWMLQQAAKEGLIDSTPVIMVTALFFFTQKTAYEIIQKPFDLDNLVDRVRRRLESDRPVRRRAVRPSNGTDSSSSNGDGVPCPEPVELILY